jgi:hypothetical protein
MKVVLTLDASPQLLAHLVHAKILLEIHLVHFLILEQAPQLLASVIEDLAHLGANTAGAVSAHLAEALRASMKIELIPDRLPSTPLFDSPSASPGPVPQKAKKIRRGRSAGASSDT